MNARAGAHRGTQCGAWLPFLPAVAFAEAADDIRDIRGPKAAPGSWVGPAIIAAAILVALCIAYIAWRRRRRGLGGPTLSLSEATLQRLESTRVLMRPETARAFGSAASELIREYIEKRFEVLAMQRTTEEFLQTLLQEPKPMLLRCRPLLEEFLQQCDLVKFAGNSLAVTDLESLFKSAHRFVLETGEPPAA
jgi:hypothetical protein